jgi:uncharacterized protein (TIGR02246 family)
MTVRDQLQSLFAAWRAGDALRSGAHFAIDGAYCEAGREPIAGRDAIVAHFTRFFRDGPRWEFVSDDLIVEGERAAVRYRFKVETQPGTWRERPGCALVRCGDGGISEWREYEG